MSHQGALPLITVEVRDEAGVVSARQRTRHLAGLAGFPVHDQVRIATAVSELSRIALLRGGGTAQFAISTDVSPQALTIRITHAGAKLDPSDPALIAGSRLLDKVEVLSDPTSILLSKSLPAETPRVNPAVFAGPLPPDAGAVPESHSRELLDLLETLRLRDQELEKRHAEVRRLSAELEETNRGVVALYAELDEKAAALRRADELKGRFLRHVSHEFRTPLNSIFALAQLLLRRTDGDLTPEQERQVGYIRQASQDLTEMVNDLLDLAKVESGVTEVHHGPVSLGHLFRGLRGVMRPLISDPAVSLVFGEPPEDLVFQSDETKIAQILRNLISNALKFTESGEVRVSHSLSESWIAIHVADTGVGIAPEDQERIFLEFTQVNNPIQRRVKGTGLGLPLSRKLAALLGGELSVTSTPGVGSTFTLKLPLPVSAPALDAEPGTVLIIDDDESARYIARQRFRGTTHSWIEAAGGHEGAERARFEHPSLILLDLRMPDRSGFDVLDELKSDPATQDIPVIIHTSRVLAPSDLERLGNRHVAILPKGESWQPATLDLIRNLLGEPHLFAGESSDA